MNFVEGGRDYLKGNDYGLFQSLLWPSTDRGTMDEDPSYSFRRPLRSASQSSRR